jgi:hypothetical protein
MSATSSVQVPASAYDGADDFSVAPSQLPADGERIEGALFTVQVSRTQNGSNGRLGTWSIWLGDRMGHERRRLGWFDSCEKPLCALCERPTAHGGVAAVAFSRADGSVELHELDAGGNSIHHATERP